MVQNRGGQTFHPKGHIWKKFEAEDRSDWKKRSTRPEVFYFPLKISDEQKKVFSLIHGRSIVGKNRL